MSFWCCCSTGGVNIPSCACQGTPTTIYQSMNVPDGFVRTIYPCTFQWGPTPAGLASLLLGSNCYLSTVQFADGFSGDLFWHLLTCQLGIYQLTRVYETSIYGSPFRDVIRYRWFISTPGNTCVPFLMARGLIYAGGDPTCVVTLSE